MKRQTKLWLISVPSLLLFLLVLVNSPASRPCVVLRPGCVCQIFFSLPLPPPLRRHQTATSRLYSVPVPAPALENQQRDWLILMDLTPNTDPGLKRQFRNP